MRDQVDALRELDGVDVEVFAFPPGGYLRAARALRRRYRGERFDVVHAHFGLTAWPALALRGPAARRDAPRHRPAPPALAADHAARRCRSSTSSRRSAPSSRARCPGAGGRRRVAVLPCGVDLDRFRPIPRAEARERLSLAPDEPCLLFPADPARAVKRFDRAQRGRPATRDS